MTDPVPGTVDADPEGRGPAVADPAVDEAVAGPAAIIALAARQGLMLATAESLTAGALVARLVDVPGASAVIAGGAACYSYEAKTRVLGVDPALLEADGAVTAEVAAAMAQGALRLYGADLAVSTTGVAGPGPDARGVPEGTVHLGLARRDGRTLTREVRLSGGRDLIRARSVEAAMSLLHRALHAPEELQLGG